MVPKISQASARGNGARSNDADPTTTSGEEDVSMMAAQLRQQSRPQLRLWLLAANVFAWIVIILAVKLIFF